MSPLFPDVIKKEVGNIPCVKLPEITVTESGPSSIQFKLNMSGIFSFTGMSFKGKPCASP